MIIAGSVIPCVGGGGSAPARWPAAAAGTISSGARSAGPASPPNTTAVRRVGQLTHHRTDRVGEGRVGHQQLGAGEVQRVGRARGRGRRC